MMAQYHLDGPACAVVLSLGLLAAMPPVAAIADQASPVIAPPPDGDTAAPQQPGDPPKAPEQALTEIIKATIDGALDQAAVRELSATEQGDLLSYFVNLDRPDLVRQLIELGIPVDQKNSFGTNAMIVAIGAGNLKSADALVQAGADRDFGTERGTPREFARRVGSGDMIALIETGKAPDKASLLRLAAGRGEIDEIEQLVRDGADPNATAGSTVSTAEDIDSDTTPILVAAAAGQAEAVRALIRLGATPDGAPLPAMTPLAAAIASGDVDLMKTLLGAGADPNRKVNGVTPLILAITIRNQSMADLLLGKGADPKILSDDGVSPAGLARVLGLEDLTQKLGGEQLQPVDLFSAIRKQDAEAVEAAIKAGADPNQTDAQGYPAVVFAAAYGDGKIVDLLLTASADPRKQGPHGISVLHAVFADTNERRGKDVVAAVLTTAITRTNASEILRLTDENGRSAGVIMISGFKSPGAADDLINELFVLNDEALSTMANLVDADGATPLLAAVLGENPQIVRLLISHGAQMANAKDGMSIQDVARARKQWDMLNALPSDRVLPDGLTKGASQNVLGDFQQKLKDWGYYKGKIDGSLGAGSQAAIIAMMKDREKEIRMMAVAENPSALDEAKKEPDSDNDQTFGLIYKSDQDTCIWKILEWKANPKKNNSTKFIGCVEGDSEWNSNGIAYVEYARGNHGIIFFGDGGWEDSQTLD